MSKERIYLCLATSIFLIGATISGLPYGYYTFLRILVSITALLFLVDSIRRQANIAVFIFLFILILFNPIFVVHLDRGLWKIIDIVCALFFWLVVADETG